jgi:hypothetical protein
MQVKKDISANPPARTVCKGCCRLLHLAAGETENQRLHKKTSVFMRMFFISRSLFIFLDCFVAALLAMTVCSLNF